MPQNGKIKWRRAGFEEIRRSPETASLLNKEVDRVMSAVGGHEGDYQGGVEHGKTRLRGYVVTRSAAAIRRESRDHTLLRALSAGGG